MSPRVVLTVVWLCGLVASLVIVELYFHLTVDGIPFLLPDDRMTFLPPVATIYGVIITGILGAWYVRRFKPPTADPDARALFLIALGCTLLWNLGVVYLVGQRLVWPRQGGDLAQDFDTAKLFATLFGFLVAPVNVYYFGIKQDAGGA